MVRLTADLIWKSPHFFNAVRERELDLRGFLLSNPTIIFFPFLLWNITCFSLMGCVSHSIIMNREQNGCYRERWCY